MDGKTPKRLVTSILPRFLYKFNTIPFNIPKDLFIKASISWSKKFILKNKEPRIVKQTLNKYKRRDICLPRYQRFIIGFANWHCRISSGTDTRTNRTELMSPKTGPCMYGTWYKTKVVSLQISKGRMAMSGEETTAYQKEENNSIPTHYQRNNFYRWTEFLNEKNKYFGNFIHRTLSSLWKLTKISF